MFLPSSGPAAPSYDMGGFSGRTSLLLSVDKAVGWEDTPDLCWDESFHSVPAGVLVLSTWLLTCQGSQSPLSTLFLSPSEGASSSPVAD